MQGSHAFGRVLEEHGIGAEDLAARLQEAGHDYPLDTVESYLEDPHAAGLELEYFQYGLQVLTLTPLKHSAAA